MSSILQHNRRSIFAGILAAAAGGLLIAFFVPSSVSAPRAGVPVVEATDTALAMMVRAPLNLPVERYDAH